MYKSPFAVKTYLIKGIITDKSNDLNKKFIAYALWKIDDWQYNNSPFLNETNRFEIIVESITKKQKYWNGEYKMGKEPCIPAGYYINENNSLSAGHYFYHSNDIDTIRDIRKFIGSESDPDNYVGGCEVFGTITGTVLSAERNEPVTDAEIVVALLTENDFNNIEQNVSKFPDTLTDNTYYKKYANVKSDGTFELTFTYTDITSKTTGFVGFVIGVKDPVVDTGKYIKSVYKFNKTSGQMINTELVTHNFPSLTYYIFDDTISRKSKDYKYSCKYDISKELIICDYINCYNTTNPICIDVYNKFRTFSINSDLSNKEKRKIKVVAEFVKDSDMNLATVSSCLPEKFLPASSTEDNDIFTVYGRLSNIGHTLNFDNEDLRDFSITIKDFDEGNDSNKYDSFIDIPEYVYQNYNIYIYAYYKIQPSLYKKILLNNSRVIVEESN